MLCLSDRLLAYTMVPKRSAVSSVPSGLSATTSQSLGGSSSLPTDHGPSKHTVPTSDPGEGHTNAPAGSPPFATPSVCRTSPPKSVLQRSPPQSRMTVPCTCGATGQNASAYNWRGCRRRRSTNSCNAEAQDPNWSEPNATQATPPSMPSSLPPTRHKPGRSSPSSRAVQQRTWAAGPLVMHRPAACSVQCLPLPGSAVSKQRSSGADAVGVAGGLSKSPQSPPSNR
mmetsp:Transcript_108985/g.314770  ORF Transcript_108985/g.314770 Transcript_108985/m.314770 type:complete len:227 (-) Transcript_108985:1545-2225(-)